MSLWPYVAKDRTATWDDLGSSVAALHATAVPALLAEWEPRIGTRWATVPYQERGGDKRLAAEVDSFAVDLAARISTSDMGALCVIQGDVSPYNVLVKDDVPVLVDMDWVAHGPAIVDSSVGRVYREAARITRDELEAFYRYFPSLESHPGFGLAMQFHQFGEFVFNLAMGSRTGEDLEWVPGSFDRLTR